MQPAFVSLIIPCRNEENYLPALCASLDAQDIQSSSVEIIFVDGMSSDYTPDILIEYALTRPNVKILKNTAITVPQAMNLGIRAATGAFIVRIDAHAEYSSDYAAKCVELLIRTGADNVGGPMRAKGIGFVGKAVGLAHHCRFGLGGGKFHDENFGGFVDTVYLGAFRRSIFDKVGYYDERLERNQDIELNARIRNAEGLIFLSSEIHSTYHCRSTFSGLWKQNFNNGVWAVYTRAIAPYALSLRHFIPLLFVTSLLLSLIVVGGPYLPLLIRILPLAATLGSYILASLFFSFSTAFKKGLLYFFVLPIVFAILHFSYGFGSLWGIVTLQNWLKSQTTNCHDKG